MMKTALQILNQVEPNGELLDTTQAIEAMELYAEMKVKDFQKSLAIGRSEVFSDKEQLADFIQRNIPICVKPTKKSKTAFVGVFTSANAMKIVVEELTDRLWKR